MKVRNTQLPAGNVQVSTKGSKTTAELWDGTYTESTEQSESGEQTLYEYHLYLIDAQPRAGLKAAIEADFGVWYAAAQEHERVSNMAKEEKQAVKEISDNLVDTLLDYDFRLMMLEELAAGIAE